jgi:hypothetical protein
VVLTRFSPFVDPAELELRISLAIADAIEALPELERERRIAYCRETGDHGVNVERMPNGWLVFSWAGEDLLWLDPRALRKSMGTGPELN